MFTDIHCHILYGTDDGPSSREQMLCMLDCAYKDNIRTICVTPHFNYDFYSDNIQKGSVAFGELCKYAKEKYPDMTLYIGNELFYYQGCTEHLKNGECRTIGKTKYVLVDFFDGEEKYAIEDAARTLISHGYIPILAHIERYRRFGRDTTDISKLKATGALIQINAPSIIGKNGLRQKILSRKLIKEGLCDIISTDAHDTKNRIHCMTDAAKYVQKHCGKQKMTELTDTNALTILAGKRI